MNLKSYQSRSGRLVKGGPCTDCGAVHSSQFRKSSRSGAILCNKCGLKEQRRLQKEKQPQPSYAHAEKEGSTEGSCLVAHHCLPVTQPNLVKKCCFCRTEESPLWRSIEEKLACNACGLRNKRWRDRIQQARTTTTLHLLRSRCLDPRISLESTAS